MEMIWKKIQESVDLVMFQRDVVGNLKTADSQIRKQEKGIGLLLFLSATSCIFTPLYKRFRVDSSTRRAKNYWYES
jgi:hypothetical protein